MDLSSAFRSEVFRPIVTLAVPGAAATAPWVLVARYYNPSISTFLDDHPTLAGVTFALIAIGAGMVIEDIGSLIENAWDAFLHPEETRRRENWFAYLSIAAQPEPIGQRYLRTLVLRLKFELAMTVALPIMLAGLTWIEFIHDLWMGPSFIIPTAILLSLTFYLLWESRNSVRTLHDLRAALIKAHKEHTRAHARDAA